MKKILFLAVLTLSTHVFAQANKTAVFCDYNANPQENSVFMDMYFDFDATSNTYQNLEVGFLNPENIGYPDYLYTSSGLLADKATDAIVTVNKDMNTLTFNLPATAVTMTDSTAVGYNIPVVDGVVTTFEITASGTMNGIVLTDAIFSCYDPSLVNNTKKPKIAKR